MEKALESAFADMHGIRHRSAAESRLRAAPDEIVQLSPQLDDSCPMAMMLFVEPSLQKPQAAEDFLLFASLPGHI